jgi:hypothetical protein
LINSLDLFPSWIRGDGLVLDQRTNIVVSKDPESCIRRQRFIVIDHDLYCYVYLKWMIIDYTCILIYSYIHIEINFYICMHVCIYMYNPVKCGLILHCSTSLSKIFYSYGDIFIAGKWLQNLDLSSSLRNRE